MTEGKIKRKDSMREWWIVRHSKCLWLQIDLQQWETSLTRFLILLMNLNHTKCFCRIFLTHVYFLMVCFTTDALSFPNPHSLSLSPSLSLGLSSILSSCPLSPFNIKSTWSFEMVINWINAFVWNTLFSFQR